MYEKNTLIVSAPNPPIGRPYKITNYSTNQSKNIIAY